MTPEQLETAARHACKLLDLDPDKWIYRYDGPNQDRKQWQILASKVREQWAINSALIKAGVGIAQVDL